MQNLPIPLAALFDDESPTLEGVLFLDEGAEVDDVGAETKLKLGPADLPPLNEFVRRISFLERTFETVALEEDEEVRATYSVFALTATAALVAAGKGGSTERTG